MDDQGLRLVLVPETRELRAVLRIVPGTRVPDAEALDGLLQANGWTAQALDPPRVAAFFEACREALAAASASAPASASVPASAPATRSAPLARVAGGAGDEVDGPARVAAAAAAVAAARAAAAAASGLGEAGTPDDIALPADGGLQDGAGILQGAGIADGAGIAQAAAAPEAQGGQHAQDGSAAALADELASEAGFGGPGDLAGAAGQAGYAVVDEAIGAVHDGAFDLEVQADNMSVLAFLRPPVGGRPVTVDDVRAALAERGVVQGIDLAALDAALARGAADPVQVAGGTPPTAPQPTRFVSELDALRQQASQADDNARVDFRELGNLVLVNPGQVLMRRIPAVPGTAGTDVFGRPIEPAAVEDQPFASGLAGVAPDENDPNVLRAAIAGAPALVPCGVNVSPVVEVEAVDIATGNVNFDGTLRVRGDVKTGMQVKVTGDVVVGGTVEAARIEAGGSITITGGVIGAIEGGLSAGEDRQAHLACGGTVQARFINNAFISAGQDVQVEREIMQSEVLAGGSIQAGPPGSMQGSISGGRCRALHLIRAGTLGSAGGIPTFLQAGLNPHANAQKAAMEQDRRRLAEERHKLEQLLAFLKANPQKAALNNLGERTLRTHAKVLADLADLDAREAQLAAELEQTDGATIEAAKRLCSGVTLQIGHRSMEIIDELRLGGKAVLHEDKVVLR